MWPPSSKQTLVASFLPRRSSQVTLPIRCCCGTRLRKFPAGSRSSNREGPFCALARSSHSASLIRDSVSVAGPSFSSSPRLRKHPGLADLRRPFPVFADSPKSPVPLAGTPFPSHSVFSLILGNSRRACGLYVPHACHPPTAPSIGREVPRGHISFHSFLAVAFLPLPRFRLRGPLQIVPRGSFLFFLIPPVSTSSAFRSCSFPSPTFFPHLF